MTKKILVTAIITGIVGVLVYLFFPKEIDQETSTNLSDEPDIYLNKVQIQAFSTSGSPAYELRADEIEQFSVQEKMLFKRLEIQIKRETGEQWHMNAQLGVIQPDAEEPSQILEPIRLLGAVNVYSSPANNPEYSFRGTDVVFDPLSNMVHSTEKVSIKAGTSTYDADSFHFDLTTKQLSLSSELGNQVEIQYENTDAE